jgi:hypothetical protein
MMRGLDMAVRRCPLLEGLRKYKGENWTGRLYNV